MTRLVLVGGGGHASDVLGCAEALQGIEVLGFLDDEPAPERVASFAERSCAYLGPLDALEALPIAVEHVLAVGYPTARIGLLMAIAPLGRQAATLVHPGSDVEAIAELAEGVVVLGGARVSSGARLGAHVHVSYLAAVGHDTQIGPCSTIMPGAMVSGEVTVGDAVLVGSNATILEGRHIGDRARIAAGAVVTADVPAGSTVAGVPAREL